MIAVSAKSRTPSSRTIPASTSMPRTKPRPVLIPMSRWSTRREALKSGVEKTTRITVPTSPDVARVCTMRKSARAISSR